MLATAVVVFREVFEAALVISIVMAACKGVAGRSLWVGIGIAAGLAGACLVAFSAGAITQAAAGMGQELLNAAILFIAVAMLGWHSVWMAQHGRELAQHVGDTGRAVAAGDRPPYALAVVVAAAVLREGAETVLFLHGIAAGEDEAASALWSGGLIGVAGGIAAGAGLYWGLLRIPTRHLFAVTNWMILLLAAGMASQAAGFLVQAGLLPPLGSPVWDTAWALSEKSLLGKVLHTLVGYVSRPAGVQVLFFAVTLAITGALMRIVGSGPPKPATPNGLKSAKTAAAIVGLGLLGVLGTSQARAEFKMRYPNIDYREVEIEHNYSTTFDKRPENNRRSTAPVEIGVGILPFWFVELEGEFSKEPGERWTFDAHTFESYLMLTEPGKYWLDFSLFTEYSRKKNRDEPDTVKLGTLFQKEHMKFLHTLNLYWEKEVGPLGGTADTVQYAWQTRYRWNQFFQPGIEFYGEIADISNPGRFNSQQFRIGPMVAGSYNLSSIGGFGKLKYEAGYLFGATTATEQQTLRTRVEFEMPF